MPPGDPRAVRPPRWRRAAKRAAAEFRADDVTLIASGVAFRATLAIFPALGVLVWVASHFVSPDRVDSALQSAAGTLPDSPREIIGLAIGNQSADGGLGHGDGPSAFGIARPMMSLLFALWSANSGVKALFVALNTIYDRAEERSFLQLLAVTLIFTVGALSISLLVITTVVVGPSFLSLDRRSVGWLTTWRYLRWPLLFLVSAGSLSLLYAYAPNHDRRPASLATVGGVAASLALTGAAAAFSWPIQHFARLSLTYGSLSTFIAFMIWLWLSFTLVLAGAELDAAIDA